MNHVVVEEYKGFQIRYKDGQFSVARSKKRYGGEYVTAEAAKNHVNAVLDERERRANRQKLDRVKRARERREQRSRRLLGDLVVRVDAGELAEWARRISVYVHDVTVRVRKDRLEVFAMDPANVLMLQTSVACVTSHDELEFGMNAQALCGLVKRSGLKGAVEIRFTNRGSDERLIWAMNVESPAVMAWLLCPDLEPRHERIPDLSFDSEAVVDAPEWNQALSRATASDDDATSVKLRMTKKSLVLRREGDYSGVESFVAATIKRLSGSVAKYSHEYLSKKAGWKPFFTRGDLKVEFKTDYPLMVTGEEGFIILAPRVDND